MTDEQQAAQIYAGTAATERAAVVAFHRTVAQLLRDESDAPSVERVGVMHDTCADAFARGDHLRSQNKVNQGGNHGAPQSEG